MDLSLFLGVSGWLLIIGFFGSLCVSIASNGTKKDAE